MHVFFSLSFYFRCLCQVLMGKKIYQLQWRFVPEPETQTETITFTWKTEKKKNYIKWDCTCESHTQYEKLNHASLSCLFYLLLLFSMCLNAVCFIHLLISFSFWAGVCCTIFFSLHIFVIAKITLKFQINFHFLFVCSYF